MTEAEWQAYTDPVRLLGHLDRPQGDRKLFLFALACCRAIWPLLPQPEMREAVEVAEHFAEGKATKEQLDAADWRLEGALYGGVEYFADRPGTSLPEGIARWLAEVQAVPSDQLRAMACCGGENLPTDLLTLLKGAGYFADHVLCMNTCEPHSPTLKWHQRFLQVSLVRDIFGNPFCPSPPLPLTVLAWNDATVRRIAEGIYEERAWDRLPTLADALLDAGCDNEEILAHCRSEGPHIRGCWALDLLLGKS